MANGSQQHKRRKQAEAKRLRVRSGRHKVQGELRQLEGRVNDDKLQKLQGACDNVTLQQDYSNNA